MDQVISQQELNAVYDNDLLGRLTDLLDRSTPVEKKLILKILEELSITGESETLETVYLTDFKEVPVSIDTFLSDPYYLGKSNGNGTQIYPGWWDVYSDVFDSDRDIYEVILSGATRIGKTRTAISMMAYMTYLIMCYRNPQRYFGLTDTTIPVIAFANLTKDLAKGVAFQEFCRTIKMSPWFNERGTFSKTAKIPLYTAYDDAIELVVASDAAHVLGMPTWALLIDEVNFARAGIKDLSISKRHMKHLYNTANARITGTFQLHGHIYGKMFTCSSKNSDDDYLSDHIEQQLNAGNTHMYIFDKPQWEVLPSFRYSSGRFHVTVGDRYKRGFVVSPENDDEAHLKEYEAEGYKILTVPDNYRPNFLADYDIALRDIAGISVVGAMGFITQEMITPNISEDRVNPFFEDYYEMGIQDNDTLERHFHLEVVPAEFKRKSMYIHIDFAEASDHIGISGGIRDGDKFIVDPITLKKISMPYFRQIFQVAMGAPRGDRMSFQKVINFIVWLKKNGFNIYMVTADRFQSTYALESMKQQGFLTEHISVDKTDQPYIGLRNLLQDQRIELIKDDLQEVEMINLQHINGRIDHKPQSACFTGDTKIALVDGRTLTINELMIEQQYRTNWVYTINETTGLIEPKPILDVFQTKLTKDMVKVTLDNDEVIYCTPDHRFMLRDGSYDIAENLTPGDSLMPLYTKVSSKGLRGYRMYYEPKTDDWHYEHRSFCLDPKIVGERDVVHHCNYSKLDNTPTNLKRMTKAKHRWIHNNCTTDYAKMAKSLQAWHTANKNTEKYQKSKQQGVLKLIIRNHYNKTGEILALAQAEQLRQLGIVQKQNEAARIHDIELLFNVDWSNTTGRFHNTLGARLSAAIHKIEAHYNVQWVTLSDAEKLSYFNKLDTIKTPKQLRHFVAIATREISKRLNVLLRELTSTSGNKSHRIKTLSLFTADDIKRAWVNYLFDVSWDELSSSERCLATRRFNRMQDTGEYFPLDMDIKYIPKKNHIIKSLSLFGTAHDIYQHNVEEYCGVYMEDIPVKQRSGYSRIYNNFCKGQLSKDEKLKRRIQDIEKTYGISWDTLDIAGRSKYSLMYHNLKNPEEKKSHYEATATAISKHVWYTNGIDNKYLLSTDEIPIGYYKGRTRSRASVEKGIATVLGRSPEEKARMAKIYGESASNRMWVTNGVDDKYIYKDSPIPDGYRLGRSKVGKNHKVKSVEHISMPCRVYDLTIQDNHNFALAAGVFVHNSNSTVMPCLANGYNSKGIGKDCSDALCGWTAAAITHADVVKPQMKPVLNAITSVNGPRNYGLGPNGKPRNLPGFGTPYRRF